MIDVESYKLELELELERERVCVRDRGRTLKARVQKYKPEC